MHICKQSLITEIELKIWFNNLFFLVIFKWADQSGILYLMLQNIFSF